MNHDSPASDGQEALEKSASTASPSMGFIAFVLGFKGGSLRMMDHDPGVELPFFCRV